MPHDITTEEHQDKALLYVLGMLGEEEQTALENHLRQGCPACETAVRSFEVVAQHLGCSVSPSPPPSRVRQKLLDQLSAQLGSVPASEAPRLKRSAKIEWEKTGREGIWIKVLRLNLSNGLATRIIRMQPGATIPAHRHPATEEFLILEGYGELLGQVLGPGDYHRAPAGSVHGPSHSEKGCVYICFSAPQYEVVTHELVPADSRDLTTVKSGSGCWRDQTETMAINTLYDAGYGTLTTALVRFRPSAKPADVGSFKANEIYVLEGKAAINTQTLGAGDYLCSESEPIAGTLQSPTGCLLLVHS